MLLLINLEINEEQMFKNSDRATVWEKINEYFKIFLAKIFFTSFFRFLNHEQYAKLMTKFKAIDNIDETKDINGSFPVDFKVI